MSTISGGPGGTTVFSTGSNETTTASASLVAAVNSQLTIGTLTRTSPTVNPTTGAGFATITGGGSYTLAPADTSAIVLPGAGAVTIQGTGGRNQQILVDTTVAVQFETNGGTGSIVTGDSPAIIGTPSSNGGAFSITTGNGNDTVDVYTGNNTVSAGLGNNLIGSGVAGSNSSNLIFANGTDIIVAASTSTGSDIIIAGSGSTLVSETGKSVTFLGTLGTATVTGGNNSFIALGFGGGQASGGPGGGNFLYGGTGTAGSTLFGGGNGDVLFARGSGQTVLIAASGNETLQGSASTGNNVFFSGQGTNVNDVIGGGSGNDLIVIGSSGNVTVDGGAGADTINFTNRGAGSSTANVLINGFRPAEGDRVQLIGFGSGQVASIVATTPAGGSTSVTLTDGTKITFGGVTNLNASNFV